MGVVASSLITHSGQKLPEEVEGLLGFYFQVMVHHRVTSGKEFIRNLKQKPWRIAALTRS